MVLINLLESLFWFPFSLNCSLAPDCVVQASASSVLTSCDFWRTHCKSSTAGFYYLNFSPIATYFLHIFYSSECSPTSTTIPRNKNKTDFHLMPSVVWKNRRSSFTNHHKVLLCFAIYFVRFHNFIFSY